MNRWADEKELYAEIASYAGDVADALCTALSRWQSSLPPLRDTYTYKDIIEHSKSSKTYKKKWLYVAAGIAAVVVCGVILFNRFVEKPAHKPAVCKAVVGNVLLIRDNESINLDSGMEIVQSDTIITEKKSMAIIEIGSATLRIDENSNVSIHSLQHTQVLSLAASMDKGILYATVQKLHKGDSILVKTKTAVAGIRGTSFLVKSDNHSTKLVVLDGRVLLTPRLPDMPTDDIPGVVVDGGKSSVVDIRTLHTIQKVVKEKKVSLDEAIKQSIPVSKADENEMQVLDALNQNVSTHIAIDEDKALGINDLYPIVSIRLYKNDLVVTTNNGIYYCENNLVQWMQDYPVESKPYIWDDYIIFQSRVLQALDTKGNTKWEIEIEGSIMGDSIVPIRDMLAIPTTKGFMYFITKNGQIRHKVNCNAPIVSKPVLFGQMVCVATADGYLYAIDVVLGVSIYRKHIGTVVSNGIFANYPEMYIVTTTSIEKVHLLRDEVIWRYNDSEIVTAVEHPGGILFATAKGTLAKLTAMGTLQWHISLSKDIHSLQYTSKGIVCIADNVFYHISDTGEVLWSYTLPSRNNEILALTPKQVYIRTENSFIILRL